MKKWFYKLIFCSIFDIHESDLEHKIGPFYVCTRCKRLLIATFGGYDRASKWRFTLIKPEVESSEP